MLRRIQAIPGGIMLIPMLIAALMNTLFPQILQIGNPTTSLFTSKGTMCIVGIMLVFAGIQVKGADLVLAAKRGGILVGVKLIIDILFGIIITIKFGMEGFWGIPTLAWVACMTSCNPGVYIALMENCGDRVDKANFAFLNIFGLPFVPVCILGFAKNFRIDYMSILATCAPFLIGMILGMLDGNIREFTKNGTGVLLPFLGFCLGSSIDLKLAISSWWMGLLLYIAYMTLQLPILFFIDRKVLKQKGHTSIAICCVAGLALTVPSIMAEIDSAYEIYKNIAVAQLSFTVVISVIVTPVLIKLIGRYSQKIS